MSQNGLTLIESRDFTALEESNEIELLSESASLIGVKEEEM